MSEQASLTSPVAVRSPVSTDTCAGINARVERDGTTEVVVEEMTRDSLIIEVAKPVGKKTAETDCERCVITDSRRSTYLSRYKYY